MRIGCDLPFFRDPGATRAFAQAAENLGYDDLGFSEHVASALDSPFPPRFGLEDPWHESFTLLGFLAAATSRIGLMSSMAVLPLRPVVLAAKQAAECQLLSAGRLRLGVSISWNPSEYRALGVDFAARAGLLEEQVEVLRLLWTQHDVSYHGRHIHLDGVAIRPLPSTPIPVWFGAGSTDTNDGRPPERALRRMARLADGYKMVAPLGAHRDAALEVMATLARYTIEAGRRPDDVAVEARIVAQLEPMDTWGELARFWRDAGATHLGLANRVAGGDVDTQIDRIRLAMELIGPQVREESVPARAVGASR